MRTLLITALAMTAFAGNSLLCRAALRDTAIDAASFTAIRVTTGAALLLAILALRTRSPRRALPGRWRSAFALFVYAAAFSFAYRSLAAGTGALILFGAVQATMIFCAVLRGERPGAAESCGWLLAASGLLVLVAPGAGAPTLHGAALMGGAGIAWGAYSLLGRREPDPLAATAGNFIRAAAFLPLLAPALSGPGLSAAGAGLAAVSGALTSGLGYVAWYAALRGLSSLQAALVQLSVPALAAAGGVALLAEPFTLRLSASALLILGGISLAVSRPSRNTRT